MRRPRGKKKFLCPEPTSQPKPSAEKGGEEENCEIWDGLVSVFCLARTPTPVPTMPC